jgi:chromosome segregation ATPase
MSTIKKITTVAAPLALGFLAVGMSVSPAFAATDSTKTVQTVASLQTKADAKITKSTSDLSKYLTRVQAMKKLSSTELATITGQLQAQLSSLASSKAKIDADTTVADVRADIKSLTAAHATFALTLSQDRLLTSTDKISTIIPQMTTVEAKLQTRITAAQTAGKDVTSAQASLTDMQAKLADANTQYTEAQSEAAGTQSDKTTLKDAQSKIKAVTQDLKAARADITAIRAEVKTVKKAY